MRAVVKKVVFVGKVGVGIYINGGLSTFIVQAVDLLDNIEALKVMGYDVKIGNEYDEDLLNDF